MKCALVVIESLRRDHLGCYGYSRDTTPHLDRLAMQSIVYRNSQSNYDITPPTFHLMMSGIQREAWWDKGLVIHPTVPEILEGRQIPTAIFTANPIPYERELDDWGFGFVRKYQHGSPPKNAEHLGNTDQLVSDALAWIAKQDSWFVVMHTAETHVPYRPREMMAVMESAPLSPQMLQRFMEWGVDPDTPMPVANVGEDLESIGKIEDTAIIPNLPPTPRNYLNAYDGAIRKTDHDLAPIYRTCVDDGEVHLMVTGDHAEAIGERGQWFRHGHGLFSELLNVPLVVHLGNGTRGIIEQPVRHDQITPTILRLFDCTDAPANLQGDLLPLVPPSMLNGVDDDSRKRLEGLGYV